MSKIAHKRKRHSVLIADAIHHSTLLDIQIGATLGFLLGMEANPALAMYESVRNATAQLDTVRAAIKAVLGDEDGKLRHYGAKSPRVRPFLCPKTVPDSTLRGNEFMRIKIGFLLSEIQFGQGAQNPEARSRAPAKSQ